MLPFVAWKYLSWYIFDFTGIEIMTFALVESVDFVVDRPFYFALVDKKSSTLFTGRIVKF